MHRRGRTLLLLLSCSGLLGAARAQCAPAWVVAGIPGTNGPVQVAGWWDRDGSGPLPEVLVVGGAFPGAGSVAAANIAWYDDSSAQWNALGSGLTGTALAVAGLPNGQLVVGGAFNTQSGGPGEHIALWNGSGFVPMGSGCNGRVHALVVLPNGDVIAGGEFTQAGGQPANHVARWDGTSWSPLGAGTDNPSGLVTQPPVSCLAVMPNGDVIAGGRFTSAGGVPASCIARWNGSAWSALGSGVQNPVAALLWNPIESLLPQANGDLLVGGAFSSIGGAAANNVARWNGATWTALGGGVPGAVLGLAARPNGDVLAAGAATGGAVQRWNGSAWSFVGGPSATVNTLAGSASGKVAAGGLWNAPGANVTVYDGTQWQALGGGGNVLGADFDNSPLCIGELADGTLVVGGAFRAVDGIPCSGLVRHDGAAWSAFGSFASSFPSPFAQSNALARAGNGDLLVGGFFSNVSGVSGNSTGIARWNGSSWQPLGSGLGGSGVAVWGMTTTANGSVLVCGQFQNAGGLPAGNVARWNGASWSTFAGGANGRVDVAVELPNGDFVVSGTFTQVGGVNATNIARWNGTTWSPLGTGLSSRASALAVLPNGDLVAAGGFAQAGGAAVGFVARWNGSSWSSLGGGMNSGIKNLIRLPDGDLLATGPFTLAGGTPAAGIARWDGATWQPVAGGLTGYIEAIHLRQSGDLVVVGNLGTVGGVATGELATLRSPCPATTTTVGVGCAGSNGIDTLRATTRPWTGSVLRTVATGLPGTGIAVVVFGTTSVQVPLAPVLPIALAGCDLLASPDVLDARVVGSQTTIDLAIPDLVGLAGRSLHQQVVTFAVDAQGNLVEATSSNALGITLGTL